MIFYNILYILYLLFQNRNDDEFDEDVEKFRFRHEGDINETFDADVGTLSIWFILDVELNLSAVST